VVAELSVAGEQIVNGKLSRQEVNVGEGKRRQGVPANVVMTLLKAPVERGNALIAIRVITAVAYQWTDSSRLAADGFEGIEARDLRVQARSAIPIE
jgi:hypothetical protein